MSSFTSRALSLVALLATFQAGCARSTSATPEEPAPKPDAQVTADEIARGPNATIEQVLMGRFPGVLVSRTTDGGISVRIRGTTSFLGSNEPLYVLDGVPMPAGVNGVLSGLSPYDIETIEVLKDAVSMTMYGIRGANGVIVITTKR